MSIVFGLFSEEELLKISTLSVKARGDVCDAKLGTGENIFCSICKDPSSCLGHIGHLELNRPVFNPLFVRKLTALLEKICPACSRAFRPEDLSCKKCGKKRNKSRTYKLHLEYSDASKQDPAATFSYNFASMKIQAQMEKKQMKKTGCLIVGSDSERYDSREIKSMLEKISPSDLHFLGFTKNSAPDRFVMSIIPIAPNCVRTSLDSTDIITKHYEKMVAIVSDPTENEGNINIRVYEEYSKLLGMFEKTSHSINIRKETDLEAFKSLKQRLTGKTGLFRRYALGKRNENCGRAVITPDPNLNVDVIGIPKAFSHDMFIKGGGEKQKIKDGDLVLLNRQPSLQRHSLMSFKVKLTRMNTISLNPAICPAYNADFDGDEMNVFGLSNYESIAEARELMYVSKCVLSPQNGQPVVYPTYDCISGVYMLTDPHTLLERDTYFDCLFASGSDWSAFKLRNPSYNPVMFRHSGVSLFSCLLPRTFNYHDKDVSIIMGNLEKGRITLKSIKGVISLLDESLVLLFIEGLQKMINRWMLETGFSIGYEDCLPSGSPDLVSSIYDHYLSIIPSLDEEDCLLELENMKNKIMSKMMDQIPSTPMMHSRPRENPFLISIRSGAKGNLNNLGQIAFLLGQQYVFTGRPHKGPYVSDDPLESKGFCRHSFVEGLTPQEYFFHCQAGREGVMNTGMNTPRTGYLQRKIGKFLEETVVMNDMTIRDGKKIIRLI